MEIMIKALIILVVGDMILNAFNYWLTIKTRVDVSIIEGLLADKIKSEKAIHTDLNNMSAKLDDMPVTILNKVQDTYIKTTSEYCEAFKTGADKLKELYESKNKSQNMAMQKWAEDFVLKCQKQIEECNEYWRSRESMIGYLNDHEGLIPDEKLTFDLIKRILNKPKGSD